MCVIARAGSGSMNRLRVQPAKLIRASDGRVPETAADCIGRSMPAPGARWTSRNLPMPAEKPRAGVRQSEMIGGEPNQFDVEEIQLCPS
jgi:hypothetical protein